MGDRPNKLFEAYCLTCAGVMGARQQTKKRIRIAASALFENRSDYKLARISLVMLHVKTVVMIFSTRLNGAVTSQKALVMLKRTLNTEEFDHQQGNKRRFWLTQLWNMTSRIPTRCAVWPTGGSKTPPRRGANRLGERRERRSRGRRRVPRRRRPCRAAQPDPRPERRVDRPAVEALQGELLSKLSSHPPARCEQSPHRGPADHEGKP